MIKRAWCAAYLQDGLKDVDEIVLFVNNVVVEFQLDVEAQGRFNLLEGFLECAERVIFFNIPSYYFTVFGFPQQSFSFLSCLSLWAVAKKLRQTQFRYSPLKHSPLLQNQNRPKH